VLVLPLPYHSLNVRRFPLTNTADIDADYKSDIPDRCVLNMLNCARNGVE